MAAPVTIEVRGRGMFPWDMLRYDRAVPHDGSTVAKLEHIACNGGRVPEDLDLLNNPLIFDCYSGPTPARWGSFLWACRERVR